MIDVKIDVGKMLSSLMGGSGQQAPTGTAPPPPEQQPQQQSPQGPQEVQEPDFSQVPLDPVITTGIKSMQQLQGSWDALFDALS